MAHKFIISDVGGTNGRFAVAHFKDGASLPDIEHVTVYPCQDYASLEDMMVNYLTQLGDQAPRHAQLAIAGPTSERRGIVTNLKWAVDAEKLENKLGLQKVSLMNDFAALAYATLYLSDDDFYPITPIDLVGETGAPVTILGPGTGFGVAMAIPSRGQWRVVSTEGGHMSFSPKTPLEHDLSQHLRRTMDHVSVEHLLSGAGLERIHRFLVEYGGSGDVTLTAAEISAAASRGDRPSCVRAVQLFLSILGSVSGDLALAHGARGGVVIGGGILPKIKHHIAQSDLLDRFKMKDQMQPYLETVPLKIVTSEISALLGAAMATFE